MTSTEPTTNPTIEPVVKTYTLTTMIEEKMTFFKKQLASLTKIMLAKPKDDDNPKSIIDHKASALIKHLVFITWLTKKRYPDTFANPANTGYQLFGLLLAEENLWKSMGWVGGIIEAARESKLLENIDNFEEFFFEMVKNGVMKEMMGLCNNCFCC